MNKDIIIAAVCAIVIITLLVTSYFVVKKIKHDNKNKNKNKTQLRIKKSQTGDSCYDTCAHAQISCLNEGTQDPMVCDTIFAKCVQKC